MQDIYAWLPREGHMKCNGIQCIYAWLTGRSICLLYICIVLDLSVGLVVCKTFMLDWLGRATWSVMLYSMLDWLGSLPSIYMLVLDWLYGTREGHIHLGGPSIYMHCPRSISGFSGMQDIYAWLTGEGHMKCNGIQGICAQLSGEGHMKCNGIQCIYAWLTGRSICLLYICIVLDLSVGLVVCKTFMLDWLEKATSSVMVFNVYMLCFHLPSID